MHINCDMMLYLQRIISSCLVHLFLPQAWPAGGPSAAAALAGIAPQALCHSPSCALYIWIQALHDSYIENHCILQLIAITKSCRSIFSCLPSHVPAAGWTGWSLGCGRARCGVGGIHSARALQSRHTLLPTNSYFEPCMEIPWLIVFVHIYIYIYECIILLVWSAAPSPAAAAAIAAQMSMGSAQAPHA